MATAARDRRTGRFAKTYWLRYETEKGPASWGLPSRGIEIIGTLVARAADRGDAWNVKVTDKDGNDVTFDFACFQD